MSRWYTVALLSMIMLLVPSLAFAVDMEFYTYGGFEAVVDAFTQLTMIFGDSAYLTLYYTVVVCGIAGGATITYVKLVSGLNTSILGWAPIAALGIVIYLGLFVPKGNLTIYDPVYNRFQTVPNVPEWGGNNRRHDERHRACVGGYRIELCQPNRLSDTGGRQGFYGALQSDDYTAYCVGYQFGFLDDQIY